MKTLFIVNDPPYGTERAYNALRLALAMGKAGAEITVFLLADAVAGARQGQQTPDGHYNIERMLKRVLAGHGTCSCAGPAWTRAVCGRMRSSRERGAARWTNSPPRPLRRTRFWRSDEGEWR